LHWCVRFCHALNPAFAALLATVLCSGQVAATDLELAALADDSVVSTTRLATNTVPANVPAAPVTAPAAGSGIAELVEFMVNLARYANWPADPARRELTLCFAHGGALPPSMFTLDDALMIRGQPVAMRVIATPKQVASCNLIWLNADVRPAPRVWLGNVGDRPILTVSNYADFTADGGIVGAYRLNGDWRFEINLEALQRSRINIAAAALRLSQKPRPIRANGESK
jgi:hypothetical protein